MMAQKVHLSGQEGIGDFTSREMSPQSGRTVRYGRKQACARREMAQLVKPIAKIQPELLKRVSATGHRSGGSGSEVMATVHGTA